MKYTLQEYTDMIVATDMNLVFRDTRYITLYV